MKILVTPTFGWVYTPTKGWIYLSALFFFPLTTFASEKFDYKPSSDCGLQKFVKDQWEPSNDTITGSLVLKPSKRDPSFWMFKYDGHWYSAKTPCFTEAPKAEGHVENPPNDTSQTGDSTHPSSDQFVDNSLFFHQTDSDHVEFTLEYTHQSATLDFVSNAAPLTSANDVTSLESLRVEIGLSPSLSLGVDGYYQNDAVTYTPTGIASNYKAAGIKDPDLFVSGRVATDGGIFHYGAKFSYSINHQYINLAGTSNEYTGGPVLTPAIGYEMKLPNGVLGFGLQYTLWKPDENVDTYSSNNYLLTETVSGGKTITGSAFYELKAAPFIAGFALLYSSSSDTSTSTPNYSGSFSTTVDNKDATSGFAFEAYGSIDLAPTVILLPAIEYGSQSYSDKTNTDLADSTSTWTFALGLRLKL